MKVEEVTHTAITLSDDDIALCDNAVSLLKKLSNADVSSYSDDEGNWISDEKIETAKEVFDFLSTHYEMEF